MTVLIENREGQNVTRIPLEDMKSGPLLKTCENNCEFHNISNNHQLSYQTYISKTR